MRIHLVLLLLVSAIACDSKSSTPAEDAGSDTAADVTAEIAEPEPEPTPPEPEPEPILPLNPQLRVAPPTLKELAQTLKEPIGRLDGESVGGESELLGVTRVSCGEGVLLQPIFKNKKGRLQVGVPTRLDVGHLVTKTGIRYEDGPFTIQANFSEDTPERLAGTLEITYKLPGKTGTAMRLDVDGKPIQAQLPPTLDAKKKGLPFYSRCTPTGYFRAWSGEEDVRGFVNILDVNKSGAPLVSIVTSPYETIQILVVPPTTNYPFPTPITLDLEEARERGHTPANVVAKVLQVPPAVAEEDASGKNLGLVKEATIFKGQATLTLVQGKDKKWVLKMTLNDVVMPDGLSGVLRDRVFERIEIEGILTDERPEAQLGSPPSWWLGEDDDGQKEELAGD